jgi:hypothetical protein
MWARNGDVLGQSDLRYRVAIGRSQTRSQRFEAACMERRRLAMRSRESMIEIIKDEPQVKPILAEMTQLGPVRTTLLSAAKWLYRLIKQ